MTAIQKVDSEQSVLMNKLGAGKLQVNWHLLFQEADVAIVSKVDPIPPRTVDAETLRRLQEIHSAKPVGDVGEVFQFQEGF